MAMKIKRKPTVCGTEINNTDGPSISDLQMTVFVDILLKLCTKSIALCKCVCKSWHALISDPQFAKLHFEQAKTCLLVRDMSYCRISRALFLLEPEDGCSFDTGYCWCGSVKEKCNRCRLNIEVKAKLKMPVRNAQVMLGHAGDDMNAIFGVKNNRNRKQIGLKSVWAHNYFIENSCNGLLCLIDETGYDDPVICNPILGEFIYLPKSSNKKDNALFFSVGLGFNPKKNQYKVIRMFSRLTTDPATAFSRRLGGSMAEIHTIGTDSWRSVEILAFNRYFESNPVYLNVALHWIYGKDGYKCIGSFDLEEEQFHSFSIPSPPHQQRAYLKMGVLGGSLCVYYTDAYGHIDIWVMKDYGISESWTRLFSIDYASDLGPPSCFRCQPISYLNNGALLMFDPSLNDLIYYDELRGLRFKHLKFIGIKSIFNVIAYTPSFISLKDIAMATNVEVLNVNSRCGKL